MGLREAARLYNVPYESLRRRVNGTVGSDCRAGPPTVLNEEEEDALVHYCFQKADMGLGLTKEDVMHTAFTAADHSGRVLHLQMEWLEGHGSMTSEHVTLA